MRNRNDELQMTAEEVFILSAVKAVEVIPDADTRLTNTICKLLEAKQHLGNYIDGIEEQEEPPATTETFLERLVKEKDELDSKLNKLNSFLSNKPKAIQISGQEQYTFLIHQADIMADYLTILNKRINNLLATID